MAPLADPPHHTTDCTPDSPTADNNIEKIRAHLHLGASEVVQNLCEQRTVSGLWHQTFRVHQAEQTCPVSTGMVKPLKR